MKNLWVLVMGFVLVACNGAGGGGQAQVSAPAGISISDFESNFKAQAEALEDAAAFRFNPCRDDLNWTDTGASTGTLEISGYAFETANISTIVRRGPCEVEITPIDGSATHKFYSLTPSAAVPEFQNDFTVVAFVQGGALSFSSLTTSHPTISVTDVAVSASLLIGEDTDQIPYTSSLIASKVNNVNHYGSTSAAIFELDSVLNTGSVELYNSQDGYIPTVETAHPSFVDGVTIPKAQVMNIQGVNGYVNVGYKGYMGFAVFDRLLTSQEKQLMSCYALYLSTKLGDTSLWDSQSATVCNL